MRIRPETAADLAAIREVNRLAFDGEDEARLVDALRDGGYVRVSLVAEEDGPGRRAHPVQRPADRDAGRHRRGPRPWPRWR